MKVEFVYFEKCKMLYISILFLFISFSSFTQKDTISTTAFKDNFIIYNDLGFNIAPFNFEINRNKLPISAKFRNNIHDFYGLGCNYKWFSARFSIQLPGSIKSAKKYGYSKYFHFGFDFTYKKFFFDVDFYRYQGYALINAYKYDSNNFSQELPNDIMNGLTTKSFSINMWYFHKKNFSMSALRGKTAVYNKLAYTWYLKSTLNSFGLNDNDTPILPNYLIDLNNTKTSASSIRAFDIGIVPGFAFVYVKNHWNCSILSGYGLVIQEKSYHITQNSRNFIGLAPRFDIRVMGGYNTPSWFLMLHTDFDNKSIQFTGLKYAQTYFNIRLVGGYRFGTK